MSDLNVEIFEIIKKTISLIGSKDQFSKVLSESIHPDKLSDVLQIIHDNISDRTIKNNIEKIKERCKKSAKKININGIPPKIEKDLFENYFSKINEADLTFIKECYIIDEKKQEYILLDPITAKVKTRIYDILQINKRIIFEPLIMRLKDILPNYDIDEILELFEEVNGINNLCENEKCPMLSPALAFLIEYIHTNEVFFDQLKLIMNLEKIINEFDIFFKHNKSYRIDFIRKINKMIRKDLLEYIITKTRLEIMRQTKSSVEQTFNTRIDRSQILTNILYTRCDKSTVPYIDRFINILRCLLCIEEYYNETLLKIGSNVIIKKNHIPVFEYEFNLNEDYSKELDKHNISELIPFFKNHKKPLSNNSLVSIKKKGEKWFIDDIDNGSIYYIRIEEKELKIYSIKDHYITAFLDDNFFNSILEKNSIILDDNTIADYGTNNSLFMHDDIYTIISALKEKWHSHFQEVSNQNRVIRKKHISNTVKISFIDELLNIIRNLPQHKPEFEESIPHWVAAMKERQK